MAVNTVSKDSKLKIQLDNGLDDKGRQVTKSKTYSKVKAAATNEDVYSVAKSLSDLQEMPVMKVTRIDEADILEA